MNRFKTYLAAASAMACIVAPASAGVTGNGFNGVHADGIVLAKSLTPAGKSFTDPKICKLPIIRNGNAQPSCGLPPVQHEGGGNHDNHDNHGNRSDRV